MATRRAGGRTRAKEGAEAGAKGETSGAFARVLRPSRPRRDAALEAVKDLEDPAEAWETLASREVIPPAWVGDPGRMFLAEEPPEVLVPPGGGRATIREIQRYLAEGPALLSHPRTPEDAAALASDPEGLLTAEQLAMESARRLAPWGSPQPAVVAWRCVVAAEWSSHASDYRHAPAGIAALDAVRHLAHPTPHDAFDYGTPRWRAAYAQACHESFRLASERGAHVTAAAIKQAAALGYPAVPAALKSARFAELPNPFEPLVALWETGYAIDVISPAALVLVAAVELPPAPAR